MIKTIHRFFYAWIFLTILPAPPLPKAKEEDWGRIAPYFTLVGFIIGILLYFLANIFVSLQFPILFSSLLVLLFWVLITGALHLDGLFDTFDGIGCQEKERKLEALRDSRIGAIGGIAGILVILFKLVTLSTIILNKIFFVILVSPMIARLVAVYSFTFLGKQKSSGKGFVSLSLILNGLKRPLDLLVNLMSFLIIFLFFIFFSGLTSHLTALIMFVLVSFFVSLVWTYWLDKHFKGHSGDTYGALIELSEVTVLALSVILKRWL